ncbi:hypothetical protein [Pseudarthrobacter oxydans]|uniref:hypothetical protein n=1 Tax=Pseudarthrobacter oxydans TaxID=1671 RepID=UPI003808C50C
MTEALVPQPGRTQVPAGLAAQLQEAVLAVDGVSAAYPARPLRQVMAAVTKEPVPHIDVVPSDDGLRVTARIGVAAEHGPDVARSVAGAIRSHLAPQPVQVHVVIVTMAPSGNG